MREEKSVSECVCVLSVNACVCKRERQRERRSVRERVCVLVRECMCVQERRTERESARAHTYTQSSDRYVCVCYQCSRVRVFICIPMIKK